MVGLLESGSYEVDTLHLVSRSSESLMSYFLCPLSFLAIELLIKLHRLCSRVFLS